MLELLYHIHYSYIHNICILAWFLWIITLLESLCRDTCLKRKHADEVELIFLFMLKLLTSLSINYIGNHHHSYYGHLFVWLCR